jgi:zinc/manganese transport system substrate-binding protein
MRAIRRIAAASAMILASALAAADDARIGIIAAENVYGDVARQIGGDRVAVLSILNNPDQDPHLFESTPATVRKVADARIIIANGANYDPWMEKLLDATPRPQRMVMTVATIIGRTAGDNPHLWYDPATIPAVAKALAGLLGRADPPHKAEYETRLQVFLASLLPLEQKIADMRGKYAGVPITATEPVFSYMANAIGLTLRNERFQMAVMNDTEPAARDLAAFEDDLKNANVDVLLYNRQVSGRLADQLIDVAREADVPVVGVTETEPANTGYVDWMLGELKDLERALQSAGKRPGGPRH